MWALYLTIGLFLGMLTAFAICMLMRPKRAEESAGEPAYEPAAAAVPLVAATTDTAETVFVPQPIFIPTPVYAAADAPLAPVPVQEVELFSLSRTDVFDHVDVMRLSSERFPVAPEVKERKTESLPDYLKCRQRCFTVVFESGDYVYNLAVRLDAETAAGLSQRHSIAHATYLTGEDWYNLEIDQSFRSKYEVYHIIDLAYGYVLTRYAEEAEETATEEFKALENECVQNTDEIERVYSAAENNYLRALEEFKAEYYSDFRITRKEIIEDTKAIGNASVTVVERGTEPHLPVSLKYKDKTYAMLYGTDAGVIMVAKLSDAYADKLAVRHPRVCRVKFPAGANWYYVPVDGAFDCKKSVYTVLNAAYAFVLAKLGTTSEYGASEANLAEKQIYTDTPALAMTEEEYLKSLEEFKAAYSTGLTRRDIVEYVHSLGDADLTAVERPLSPQMPASLKYKGKTYAMLYGTETGVCMICKLSNDYAAELSSVHAGVGKVKFPAGPNWYYVPLDSSFSTESAHAVLNNSLNFTKAYILAKQAEKKLNAKHQTKTTSNSTNAK